MPVYQITVKPGSSQEKIITTGNNTLTVYIRAKAHDGEANTSLVKLLSKYFGVPKTSIAITRGSHSRTKIIEL